MTAEYAGDGDCKSTIALPSNGRLLDDRFYNELVRFLACYPIAGNVPDGHPSPYVIELEYQWGENRSRPKRYD